MKNKNKVLILAVFVLVLIKSIYLVKIDFSIVFYKFIISKIKSGITLKYIIIYKKILKRLTFYKKLLLKLLLFLVFCKQC